ncbi:sulfatase-like hydrolase/transferase [Fuerstiella marisgermanici]|nr:sulfatase-like hydrolase/transferase [Fuerstiella marisgermanici]
MPFALFLPSPVYASTSDKSTPRPNIIVILADDLGYGDLSCYNSKCAYKTPRLDRMAKEGVRFTDAHSPSTICSPSRYGLFSGNQIYRSTGRGGGAFEGPGGPSYLKPGTLTIGQMLQEQGYRTGVFGKWHVGLSWFDKDGKRLGGGFENSLLIDYEKSTPLIDGPNQRGFDQSFITPNCPNTDPLYVYIDNGMVPVPASQRHDRNSLPNPGGKWRWDNDEGWKSPDYNFMNADLLFYEKTKTFITDHRRNTPNKPFFAVLSTQITHAPVLPADEFNSATQAGPRGDFVYELDTLVGKTLDLLQELGIDDNTLVLFNSDNGAETLHVDWMRRDHQHDASGGWRGMKRDGWEGGHRVPFIARWPGHIPAGRVTTQMTNTTDIFATLASIVGYKLPDDAAVDSFDMLPAMLGTVEDDAPIRPHMLTQSFRGEFQIRQGDWKYLDHTGSGGNSYARGMMKEYALPELAPEAPGQLYNLKADPGETQNLFFSEAAKRIELQSLLRQLKSSGRSAPRGRQPVSEIPQQLIVPPSALLQIVDCCAICYCPASPRRGADMRGLITAVEGLSVSSLDWAPLRAIIEENQTFLITSHVRPDADALGSELGMAAILQAFGKTATIVNATSPPTTLHFLNPDGGILKLNEDIPRDKLPDVDVHIVVDTSAWQQLGAMADVVQKAGKKRVVIDHHVSSDNMGATEFKDVQSAATGELIYDAACFLGVTFDATVASALYAAIATDTGWFRFPSTSGDTMRTAAALMELGAEPHELFRLLNEQKSLPRMHLKGRVLARMTTLCDNRLAWIYVDKQDLDETKSVPSDTEGLVNECLTLAGVEAAFIAVQLPSGMIKFSLRCRPPHDVAALAENFGGGGHKLASGATLEGPLTEASSKVLAKFTEMMSDSSGE